MSATHCRCSQAFGLHHNPACALGGVVSADNYLPVPTPVDAARLVELLIEARNQLSFVGGLGEPDTDQERSVLRHEKAVSASMAKAIHDHLTEIGQNDRPEIEL